MGGIDLLIILTIMSSLAAARADNFYYPKDWDPSKGTLTTFYKTKKSGGQPPSFSGVKNPNKIRFEMMFNVRCLGCGNSIGKGVRFNAHKKHVDQYLSTKIYEFTMNCHLCGHLLSVRTDPKNCDYILSGGLEKRPETLGAAEADIPVDQKALGEHKKQLESNAFYKLENARADRVKADMDVPRLEKLMELKERDKDFHSLNQLLRKRNREHKQIQLKEEEEAKKPKNFALPLID